MYILNMKGCVIFKGIIYFLYQKALNEHFTPALWLHNNLCELTALEQKLKSWFCTQKPVLKVRLKISGIQK